MSETTRCPACGTPSPIAAEACATCGRPFETIDVTSSAHPIPPGGAVKETSEAEALRAVAENMARRRAAADVAAPPRAGTPEFAAAGRPPHYAGFVIRVVAFTIDLVILAAATMPLSLAVIYGVRIGLVASKAPVRFAETEEALAQLVGYAWLAMAALYFMALHRGTGQTIGKAVVGIAVRRGRDLARIGILRSLLRVVGYAISSAFFFLGFTTIMANRRKRGWHDYLTGTCVVHLAPEEV
ncbi:MAG TPA: RDD family protein [Candidatus Binatia bacterium]|jgi:uncharacterized RDD family membrane protein YckC